MRDESVGKCGSDGLADELNVTDEKRDFESLDGKTLALADHK